ncbi:MULTISPECIES: 3-hydroxyacyl-ACP dehydratase FabZ [Psychrobacter]|jgi:3-hydroxyacyl-[acyl-carrier-protein] dehydratase|uniref:3-hydroxyacyl-ACP dehydratase FabZ n=1 Tax=Psychrobacter TaxID=497 RepID=UPI000045E400|nr:MULTISPECIES: 3-hydroxyacyl-ACP dehydratase FabZ [Psychrobacter]AAZ19375.1 3-hydroxyacyl-[acyl-carrier-protein] dehydratase [Psychrobacter arcticus 273-4]AGP49269.1 3-hydroxyacyl-ACP dehydratase [Psychrobacter sp. G]KAA0934939.1 3-hydroxyacyl-ACP dehydratase FabZ [Psychrobacter sp. ANT_H59]MBA2057525.1 3-hydroxyacyl-ACP dehydratase FabZ [Psychrobacter sp. D2]WAI87421.1 3-hydroxyacyl-[acyl-carrier-protein] dehydratase FabZ [Psychrobacter sp. SC65A.3]|tara:strand:- start:27772 stop:28281 length:510 start_codon:yes stop_codon:yes gene_type:complete
MSTSNIDNPTAEDIKSLAEQGLTLPLTYHTLKHYLPHRYPFLLVDKIVACTPGECITGIKNVTINEEFFNGHFPDEPIMPGVLMVECMAQVSGVLGFISAGLTAEDGYLYLFAGVDKVRFKRRVIPGDQLIIRSKIVMQKQGIYKFDCTVHVEDELAVSAQIMIARQEQ